MSTGSVHCTRLRTLCIPDGQLLAISPARFWSDAIQPTLCGAELAEKPGNEVRRSRVDKHCGPYHPVEEAA
jgi:hypothetical protein